MYSTVSEIRSEAWLNNNTYITDPQIAVYQNRSYSIIQSALASIYDLTVLIDANADFNNSPAQWLLKNIEILLSAWYLMMKWYGTDGLGSQDSEARDKINEGYSILNSLASQKTRLFRNDLTEFAKKGNKQLGPTTSTISTAPIFSIWSRD